MAKKEYNALKADEFLRKELKTLSDEFDCLKKTYLEHCHPNNKSPPMKVK